jgi:hypothetical protein
MNNVDRLHPRAWIIGGVLLIVSSFLGLALTSLRTFIPGVAVLGPLSFGCACIVLAVGSSAKDSVTDRRALGTSGLIALGVWVPLQSLIQLLLAPSAPGVVQFAAVSESPRVSWRV